MPLFARQLPTPQRVPDLSRFVDTPRQQKDPCFACSLPFDCDPTSPECKFVNTSFQTPERYSRGLERERQELLEELQADGVVVVGKGRHAVQYVTDETPEERKRRQNREYMRRARTK